ncbi:hypothetical protein HMPREF9103_03212 [Lentilactobacillus parafarraginis F0439]|uniref:Uncharacterized protein n=1 Tax=Lentilactobacillus parafarraginis F0439 TaxID=797515 RepID=G9ZTX7_9LACO|nr:hypothetical protein HMPREF9103_03212 [Lentilactobacillus parafarraginis F0439]
MLITLSRWRWQFKPRFHGYVNPLQFYTYDYSNHHSEFIDILDTPSFVKVKQTIIDILNQQNSKHRSSDVLAFAPLPWHTVNSKK